MKMHNALLQDIRLLRQRESLTRSMDVNSEEFKQVVLKNPGITVPTRSGIDQSIKYVTRSLPKESRAVYKKNVALCNILAKKVKQICCREDDDTGLVCLQKWIYYPEILEAWFDYDKLDVKFLNQVYLIYAVWNKQLSGNLKEGVEDAKDLSDVDAALDLVMAKAPPGEEWSSDSEKDVDNLPEEKTQTDSRQQTEPVSVADEHTETESTDDIQQAKPSETSDIPDAAE